MKNIFVAVSAIALAGCAASGPRLPDPEPIDQSKIEKPEDWDNWGKGTTPDTPSAPAAPHGVRLTGEQIVSTFKGTVLRGCYPNGTKFAETLGSDGKFYDALNNNAELGQWGVKDDQLCFGYPATAERAAQTSCFVVVNSASTYEFYLPDGSAKVASTACE